MALIKCPECNEEISDKAKKCIHCGYPLNNIEKKEEPKPKKEVKKESTKQLDGLTSAWLIIATLICFGIAFLELVSPIAFHLETNTFIIGSLSFNTKINILLILDVLLGVSYINIMLSKNKLSMVFFYIINFLILVLCLSRGLNVIPLLYIACVILNTIITTFAVRGRLNDDNKISIVSIILTILGILLSILASFLIFREIEENNKDHSVHIAVFYVEPCKYCDSFFQYVEDVDTFIHIKKLDATNSENYGLLKSIANSYGVKEENIAYPFILINDRYYIGYSEDNKKEIDDWVHKISDKGNSYDFIERYKSEHEIKPAVPANATPKEKLIAYLKDQENATCTSSKCTYTFDSKVLITYYTVDFDKKIFRSDANIDGPQNEIYNFSKDTGSAYTESNTGFRVEVSVNVTFNKDEYKYTWKSNLKGVDESARIMAEQVDSLRTTFLKWCDELNIDPKSI